jgi:AAA domain
MSTIFSKITKGRISEPQKFVIYGPQGVGKSTLASLFSYPLFLDTEDGTRRMSVDRINTNTLGDFDAAVKELAKEGTTKTGFQTIVVDTIDWLESRMKEQVAKTVSFKDRSFGREESFVGDELTGRLAALSALVRVGFNVVLLAHSTTVKVDLPDQPSAFDRYELDMGKKYCAPMVKHWADHLLFLKWKLSVREPDAGKNKVIGKGERLLCLSQAASYDAKTRSSLSGEHVMSSPPTVGLIKQIFDDVGAPWGGAAVVPTPAEIGVGLGEVLGNGSPADGAGLTGTAAVIHGDGSAVSAAAATTADTTLPSANASRSELPDVELARIIGASEAAVNAYLLGRNNITRDQSYRSIKADVRARIMKNPAGFLKVVLAKEGRAA